MYCTGGCRTGREVLTAGMIAPAPSEFGPGAN